MEVLAVGISLLCCLIACFIAKRKMKVKKASGKETAAVSDSTAAAFELGQLQKEKRTVV